MGSRRRLGLRHRSRTEPIRRRRKEKTYIVLLKKTVTSGNELRHAGQGNASNRSNTQEIQTSPTRHKSSSDSQIGPPKFTELHDNEGPKRKASEMGRGAK